jgi:aryl-alcohol dehydrogenase-like predicted oxidoreductase
MGLDYIDIFMLHEQESALTLKGHREAMEYFLKAKDKGYIRALWSVHPSCGMRQGGNRNGRNTGYTPVSEH